MPKLVLEHKKLWDTIMLCFVDIEKTEKTCTATIHEGRPAVGRQVHDLQLHRDTTVNVNGEDYVLGDLVRALIEFRDDDVRRAFDHRGQLEIGEFLYKQIFAGVSPEQLRSSGNEDMDLRIVTRDAFIARLPWVLLAHDGLFLSTLGWSISLARGHQVEDVELPPDPRMLIIAPEPLGVPPTEAKEHLKELDEALSLIDPRLSIGSDIRVTHTWKDFISTLQDFKPHIIYYYGHGVGDENNSQLVFASGEKRKGMHRPVADMAQALREMQEPPLLVYLNCCSGDAGGVLGAGRQFSDRPVVLTNRTVSYIQAARAQALAFWKSLLLDGLSPHRAVCCMLGKLTTLDLSFQDARWMTPVLYCHYKNWLSTPPPRVDALEHDPHWRLKLDRIAQFGSVSLQTRDMLRERRPRSLAYVWYGLDGQGVDIFHQRLRVQLRQDVSANTHFIEIRPEWPMELENPARSFEDMMVHAFEAVLLQDIPAQIRAKTGGASGRQTLVVIRHEPIRSPKFITPKSLKEYLQWWDETFTPLLTQHVYALLTVSFIVKKPAAFRSLVLNKYAIYDMAFSRTVFRLLDELERVGMKDLYDFLQTHNIRLPGTRQETILKNIMDETGGHYEMTIHKLRTLVERNWGKTEKESQDSIQDDEEDDY